MTDPVLSNQVFVLTGASGFLGKHLHQRLLKAGAKVLEVKRTAWSAPKILNNISDKPNAVIHCATVYGRRGEKPEEITKFNFTESARLLNETAEHGIPCFVNIDTALNPEVNTYAASKHQLTRKFIEFKDRLKVLNIVVDQFYGAGEAKTQFISRIAEACLRGDSEIPLTSGKQKRSFLYVSDLVEGITQILSKKDSLSGSIRLNGEACEVREVVRKISELTEAKTNLNFGALPDRANEIRSDFWALPTLPASVWQTKVELEQGIRDVIGNLRKELQ